MAIFLDYHSALRALTGTKTLRGGHSPGPDHLSVALKHGPTGAFMAGNTPCQKHPLQFQRLPPAVWPISISRAPIPQNQWRAEESSIENLALPFSVALR